LLISIVIPVFNEENLIYPILRRIDNIKNLSKEIIIVDDGSTDNTRTIIEKNCKGLFNKFVSLEKNFGKGHALREGFKLVSGDIVIVQDADLEYDPEDYYKLVSPIIKSEEKVVYGSRVIKGAKRTRPNSIDTFIRILANKFLTSLSNLLNDQTLTDAHTCYKVFKSEILNEIELVENGFNFCPEITAKISKLGIKIMEVPISYHGRTHKEGKKISFVDGFKAIYAILFYNIVYRKKNNIKSS
tara:strand:- start:2871 stop:3599 length:729 start_codon:yes stop_codon:yes gene_type:complete